MSITEPILTYVMSTFAMMEGGKNPNIGTRPALPFKMFTLNEPSSTPSLSVGSEPSDAIDQHGAVTRRETSQIAYTR